MAESLYLRQEQSILEETVQWFYKSIPPNGGSPLHEKPENLENNLLPYLANKYGIGREKAHRYFLAVYWYLLDHFLLEVEVCGTGRDFTYALRNNPTPEGKQLLGRLVLHHYEVRDRMGFFSAGKQ